MIYADAVYHEVLLRDGTKSDELIMIDVIGVLDDNCTGKHVKCVLTADLKAEAGTETHLDQGFGNTSGLKDIS